jgi:hypothetical protein
VKRLALNASPRGKKSNSRLIISWIGAGLERAVGEGAGGLEVADLAAAAALPAQVQAFLEADEALIVMPLYTDQAPGVFMRFVDALAQRLDADPAGAGQALAGKRVGFVVQSGFPESLQSEALRDWLLRLSERLGFHCLGVALRGGIEGIRLRPEKSLRRLRSMYEELGRAMGRGEDFPVDTLARLSRPRTLSWPTKLVLIALKPTGLTDFYWNYMLRKNGAWEKRFDAPYA